MQGIFGMGIRYDGDVENPQKNKKISEFQDEILDKISHLKNNGYKVEVIWGCEF